MFTGVFHFVFIACVGFFPTSDSAQCTPCNEGVDKIVLELQGYIKEHSPVIRDDIEYCHNLTVDGAYTMVRDGDICSEKLNDEADCSLQDMDIKFLRINFTCEANIEQIKKEIEQNQGKGVVNGAKGIGTQMTGKKMKRGLFDKQLPPGVEIPKTYLVGYWVDVALLGKTKLCKKDKSRSEVEPFVLKNKNLDALMVSCTGDKMVEDVCATGEGMDEIKKMIGIPVTVVAGSIVREMVLSGKCDMATKFRCD